MRLTLHHQHAWDISPAAARLLQAELRAKLVAEDCLPACVQTVAGVDAGFEEGKITRAAVAVLAFPGLTLIESSVARQPTAFPYVPGLLSFREVPVLLEALSGLARLPDVLICDGQGIAHPRRLGIASHLGLLLDMPTVGVAKSRLIGEHEPVPEAKGSHVPLYDGAEIIGAVLRSRERVRPLYISVGHKISLTSAIELVMRCLTRYRLPETTRQAHRLASH